MGISIKVKHLDFAIQTEYIMSKSNKKSKRDRSNSTSDEKSIKDHMGNEKFIEPESEAPSINTTKWNINTTNDSTAHIMC